MHIDFAKLSSFINEDFPVRSLSLALIAALSATLPVLAAPTQDEFAAARLAYIDGD